MVHMSLTLLIAIGACAGAAMALTTQAWIYRKKQKVLLNKLSTEASSLIKRMQDTHTDDEDPDIDIPELSSMLHSSKYLTTLVTVLVKKAGGEVRLVEDDFVDTGTKEYVSVYVDTTDSSILLRLNCLLPIVYDDDEILYN
jgi:hypothetical protein